MNVIRFRSNLNQIVIYKYSNTYFELIFYNMRTETIKKRQELSNIDEPFEFDKSSQFIRLLLNSDLFDYTTHDGKYKFQFNNNAKLQLL